MALSKNLTTMMYAVDEENNVRPGYILSQDEDTTHFNTIYSDNINVQTSHVFATMAEAEAERDGTNVSEQPAQTAAVTDDAQADSGDGDCDDALKCEHGENIVYCTVCYAHHKQLSSTLEDMPMTNSEPMSHEEAIDEVARLGRRVGELTNDCRSLYTACDYQHSQAEKFSREHAALMRELADVRAANAALKAELITAWKYVDDIAPNKAAEKEAKKQLKKLGVKSTYN